MVIKAGIIGYSAGNGHPYSFSAIVNGYNKLAFEQSGWTPILDYLERQPKDAIGIENARITHAWTQDKTITEQLCQCSNIPNAVSNYLDMIGKVDAIIIARDDYSCHYDIAREFLQHNIPVFVDKPLTLNLNELTYFEPYLKNGLLMSTSGLRYAQELDSLRADISSLGDIKRIDAVVLNDLEKYGIHMIDALLGLGYGPLHSVMRLPTPVESYLIECKSGIPLNLSCLGQVNKTFHLSFYGTKAHHHVDLHNNFEAFKRTLQQFFTMIETKSPVIDANETIEAMQLIENAKQLKPFETFTLNHAHEKKDIPCLT
ncbi:Gfo/Idh/MocA family oxidoreductase [Legionella sp. W05-934-2]|uniref:Gfo/Idh/MocA family oxidoreductase n=1 Tax=Legionella sp. W05-934-2 TaxID=1198649 RepID=UPI0034630A4D